MEIRNGMKFDIGSSNHYIIKNVYGVKGEVWSLSLKDNDYSNFCSANYGERDFSTNGSLKITHYPYQAGDWVKILVCELGEKQGNICKVLSVTGEESVRFSKFESSFSAIRPAFSWEIPKEEKVEKVEKVPEYAECIKAVTKYYTAGKIYRIKSGYVEDNKGGCDLTKYGESENEGNSQFKPSTKEAYEAQFGEKVETKVIMDNKIKVGDRVSVTGKWDNAVFKEDIGTVDSAGTYMTIKFDTCRDKYLWGIGKNMFNVPDKMVTKINTENMNDLDKMIAEQDSYLTVTSTTKYAEASKLSPASEMKTTISGLKPRSKKVCYTSTTIKIAM